MIDIKIMREIIEKLSSNFHLSVSICNPGGRIIVSTEASRVGEMNLLAIEALNINSKMTMPADGRSKTAGAAIPLTFQGSRIGAVILNSQHPISPDASELFCKSIEFLYEEGILSRQKQSHTQERNQFLYEWLHLQSEYPDALIKQGELLGIDITKSRTVIVMERDRRHFFTSSSILQRLLDEHDLMFSLSESRVLIMLDEQIPLTRRYRRILAAGSGCHAGVCSGECHLHTACESAQESLSLGKLLFPEESVHEFNKMKLAIGLSHMNIPGIEEAFCTLIQKGQAAQLAETAVAYIQLNGDIQRISTKLHIHRNSIPYRLKRIQQLSGKNLTDSYDLLWLYASFIQYKKNQGL